MTVQYIEHLWAKPSEVEDLVRLFTLLRNRRGWNYMSSSYTNNYLVGMDEPED